MKIIVESNFGDELFSEYFVAHEVSAHNAAAMVARLNAHKDAEHDPGYYRAVTDDYVLKVRES